MNMTYRTAEILEAMPSFAKTHYRKDELLPELLALQSELVTQTFNGIHAENARLRIWDVENHLQKLNDDRGNVADELLAQFKADCKIICNAIKGEMSGNAGEYKAFRSLETVRCKYKLLKNIEFALGDHRTELDGIVLTEKAIYIIEVKNTAKDIVIDERGNYCRVSHTLIFDKNIGEKMNDKAYLLREALKGAGIEKPNIVSLVVFTNSSVHVENHFPHITTCFLAELPHIIEGYTGETFYTEEMISQMQDAIEHAKCCESYPLPVDVTRFKQCFADLLVTLESANEKESEEPAGTIDQSVHQDHEHEYESVGFERGRKGLPIKSFVSVAAVVACVIIPTVAVGVAKLRRR